MFEFLYDREKIQIVTKDDFGNEIISEAWNIEHPLRLDEEGQQIHLATEITNILELGCKVLINGYGDDSLVIINFLVDLTNEQKLVLDDIVYKHKNNL
jgi:hypothetical protein